MPEELVARIRDLASAIVQEALSAREVAGRLGDSVEDPGHGLPLLVRPGDGSIDQASVAGRTGEPTLSHVEMELAEGVGLTVADLEAAFGDYSAPPRVHHDSPVRLVFARVAEGPAGSATLIAVVDPAADGDMGGSEVATVTLRFDAGG